MTPSSPLILGGLLAALAGLGVAPHAIGPLRAQDTPAGEPPGELVTDRPDQTESAAVVPPGYVQVETGVLFSRDEAGGEETETVEGPGTLVRIGLGSRTELRLGWDGWVREERELAGARGGSRADGPADAEVGAKMKLRDEAGRLAEAALLVGVSLPIGDDELTSDRLDPSLLLALAHTLSERLSLGYNAGVVWSSEVGDQGVRETYSHLVYTGALGVGLTDRLGAFAELFGEEPLDAPGGSVVSADGGFTWLLRPKLQLDAYAGAGLTEEAPDWFAGAGLSLRWPR
ncbi:MAG TPA: transporter [Thermoanaerobaculia bacterium]|nr:transporter [Thermoanaerobaculia bacterium]